MAQEEGGVEDGRMELSDRQHTNGRGEKRERKDEFNVQ
jgi:hypothetical protein